MNFRRTVNAMNIRRTTLGGLTIAALTALIVPACTAGDSGTLGPAPTLSAQPHRSTPSATPRPLPSDQPTADPSSPGPGQPDRPTAEPPTPKPRPEDPGSPGKIHTFQLWYARDGKLTVTTRATPWTPAVARLALTNLVAGPSRAEAAAGLTSPIDTGTTFTIASIRDGVATVDLPASFFGGGRTPARMRQAQVVYTLTQYPTITRVRLQASGAVKSAGGRADYADLLPRITVSMPIIGSTVTSPVIVAGTADVFEATVSMRLLDASGNEIATTFTTATCGTGCRGNYAKPVHFTVTRTQPGTIQVYEVSMEDGSHNEVVSIPVILSP